jgi:hypothetical protein
MYFLYPYERERKNRTPDLRGCKADELLKRNSSVRWQLRKPVGGIWGIPKSLT